MRNVGNTEPDDDINSSDVSFFDWFGCAEINWFLLISFVSSCTGVVK